MSRRIASFIIASIVIIAAILLAVWETSEIRSFAGQYVSVDAVDSTYELTLSPSGRLTVSDIGAGNPAVDGLILRTSPSDSKYTLKCGGETDEVFLDLGESDGRASVWLSWIGRVENDETNESFRVIIIETGTARMQFNEKGYED